MLREVTRYTAQVLMPPNWDERYITVFNSSYDEVGVEGVKSMTTKLRSAGLAIETLPGPPLLPPGLTPLEISQRGRALAQAGVIGVREGPSRRDPETLELLFDTIRRQVNPNHGLKRADHLPVGVHRPGRAHLAPDGQQRLQHRRARATCPPADLRLRISYQDLADIVGERLDPLRALASGRLRPRGNPLALARLAKVFPRA